MIRNIRSKYVDQMCKVLLQRYMNGQLAIELEDPDDGEPIAHVTACIPQAAVLMTSTQVLVKDYSENEGMLAALIKAGVVGEPCGTVPSGFIQLSVCTVCADLLNHEPVIQENY